MNRGLSPWVSAAGTLRSTKKFLRTVSVAVVWPASVSAPGDAPGRDAVLRESASGP